MNCLNDYFVSVFIKDEKLDDKNFPVKCENVCMDPSFGIADVREQLENLNVNKSIGTIKRS